MKICKQSCGDDCSSSTESLERNGNLRITKNNLTVEIYAYDSVKTITNFLRNGIYNFGMDLFYGSTNQNTGVLITLKNAIQQESEKQGLSIPYSVYLKLTPTGYYNGKFKKNKPSVYLKHKKMVILTTNRSYASASCHTYIYINAKCLIADVNLCDIIRLGERAQLMVKAVSSETGQLLCKVIVPGRVKPRMPVRFPQKFEKANKKITPEQIEDLKFAIDNDINVIILHNPGNIEWYNDLHETLAELKSGQLYLFTRLILSDLEKMQHTEWIANSYDGFLIDCSNNVIKDDRIVKLSSGAKYVMEQSYSKRKPLLLQGLWSKFIDPVDYKYAFRYPDKYILPFESSFLRLYESIFHKFTQLNNLDKQIEKTSPLNSNIALAYSIVAASLDFRADVFIVCCRGNQPAVQISRFRPHATIVIVTSLKKMSNYLSMYHNTCVLTWDDDRSEIEISEEKDTHQKLVHGVQYAISRELIDEHSTVILVFQMPKPFFGYADRYAVIKIEEGYVETIKSLFSLSL